VEKVISIVLVDEENILLKVSRSNGFDESILGFCYNFPNLRSRPQSLGSILTIQPCCDICRGGYLPLDKPRTKLKNGHKHGRRGLTKIKKANYLV
jgi:hypothetical protein